jgi:hypothetical protein
VDSRTVIQGNPQYAFLYGCQCLLVGDLARAWVGLCPGAKYSIDCHSGANGQQFGGDYMVIQVGPFRSPLGIRGQIYCALWKKYGAHRGGNKKLQLYPTNLAYSTPTMRCKALGHRAGVECVG